MDQSKVFCLRRGLLKCLAFLAVPKMCSVLMQKHSFVEGLWYLPVPQWKILIVVGFVYVAVVVASVVVVAVVVVVADLVVEFVVAVFVAAAAVMVEYIVVVAVAVVFEYHFVVAVLFVECIVVAAGVVSRIGSVLVGGGTFQALLEHLVRHQFHELCRLAAVQPLEGEEVAVYASDSRAVVNNVHKNSSLVRENDDHRSEYSGLFVWH